MKIENDQPNALTGQTDAVNSTAGASGVGKAHGKHHHHHSGDQLTLSPEAQLLKAAEQAAAGKPEIRTELVDKMRALLAEGKLGGDATALAESLINDLTENE